MTNLWQFWGGPGSWPYELFDGQRRRLNRRLVERLATRALGGGNRRVLEAGAGPAYASSLLARHRAVRLSVALDIDPEALAVARRHDPGLTAVVGDLYRLPFRTGVFDLVWNSSTLEHLEAPTAALAEMRRVARPEGYVFVGVPYRFGPLGWQPLVAATALGVWIGTVFDRRRLAHLCAEQRLVPVEAVTYFFRFFVGVLARKAAE